MDLYSSERERMFSMKLDDLIDPFVNAEDGMIYYYRRSTDEIVVLVNDQFADDDSNDKLAEAIDDNRDDYVSFPTEIDIHDYQIMRDYVDQVADDRQRERLEQAISGRGAFRRFRSTIEQLGLLEQWYDFEAQAYHDMAVEWCHENDVPYEE
ncbi:hypothetical protein D6U18_06120 [Lactiplantibacillus pentosus]|uniref:DUF4375 domain-containing protein n=2 Tax=Lactiplantibacillus pentosus TaxID=1589 RepID=A0ABD7IR97_LACPE|nr:hypothetical protein D6U18_06120 [Lactiplantibacillus pentosus]